MSAKLFSSFAIFPVMFLFKYVDVTNPDVVMYVRFGYALAVALSLMLYGVVYLKITQAKDKTLVTIKPQPQPFGQPPIGEHRTITAEEYDLEEVMKALKQTVMGMVITAGIVYKFELIQPLFFQAFMTPKNVLTSPLVQIHLFGFKPEGELRRPFKAENPFGALFGGDNAEEAPAAAPAAAPAPETKKITAKENEKKGKQPKKTSESPAPVEKEEKSTKANKAAAAAAAATKKEEEELQEVKEQVKEEEPIVEKEEKSNKQKNGKKDNKKAAKNEEENKEPAKEEIQVEEKKQPVEEKKPEEDTPVAESSPEVVREEILAEDPQSEGAVRQRKGKKSRRDD